MAGFYNMGGGAVRGGYAARIDNRPIEGFRPVVGGGSNPQSVFDEARRQVEAANAANESRYQQGLQGYGDLRNRTMAEIGKVGEQEKTDTERSVARNRAQRMQDLVSRGLASSSSVGSVERGYEREKSDALGRLNDLLLRLRLGTDERLTSMLEGFRERKTEAGPDLQGLYGMAQNVGMGNVGFGGMGGGTQQRQGFNLGGWAQQQQMMQNKQAWDAYNARQTQQAAAPQTRSTSLGSRYTAPVSQVPSVFSPPSYRPKESIFNPLLG